MPNIKISDLPPIAIPIALDNTFIEVQAVEGGVDVSRKATVDQIASAGGAPSDATYVTLTTNAELTNERVLTGGFGITVTDGGAGNPVTLAFDVAESPVVVTGAWRFNNTSGVTLGVSTELNFRNPADDSTTILQSLNGSFQFGIAGAGFGVDFLDFGGSFIHYEFGAPLFVDEQAAANADQTAKGQWWVRDDAPNVPMFTDDLGNDFVLNTGGYFVLSATDRVVGSNAGTSQTGDNVFLSNALAGDNNIADAVIAVGPNALAAAVELEFEGSIAIGRNAGANIGDTRDPWVIIGDGAAGNVVTRTFHDGNTIIGTRALGALAGTANVQNVTVIGHDALSDMTGAGGLGIAGNVVIIGSDAGTGAVGASVTSSVVIGSRACSDLTTGGVSDSVIIGNAAAESLGGANLNVLIGANNTQNAVNIDNSIVIGGNTFSISVAQTADQIIIGHSSVPGIVSGEKNILIGNTVGVNGTQRDFQGCVVIGHNAGNNLIDDQDIFAIEMPQSPSTNISRPFLFGNFLNGNLALLNIAALVGGVEAGARIVPAWADAAPTAGQGVFSMYGAGTDLGATTDADFVHFWIRTSDTAYMLQYPGGDTISILHNGTDSIIANSAGAMQLSGTGAVIFNSNSVEGLRLTEDNSGVLQVPSAAVTITAFAGGGQGSAVALIHSYNVITVVATAGDSVRLPDVFSVNTVIYIKNDDATEAADVFPASGDDLGAGVNTAVSLVAGASLTFIATAGSSTWTQLIVDTVSGGIATALLATNAAGPEIEDAAATSSNPTLIPNRADSDTGFGWTSADRGTLIAGGAIVAEFLNTAGVDQLILPLQNNAAAPSLAFGDGDTGFHEIADDTVRFAAAGANVFSMNASGIQFENGAQIRDEVTSATNPVFIPQGTDLDTGIGRAAVDQLSLISGGVEGLRLTETDSGVVQVPAASVAVTAFAGGGQGSATALIHSYNVITVVATAGDSVRLPAVFAINSLVYIKNDDAADAADVFPASGDDLGAGVDTAISLAAGESASFIATVANSTWTPWIVDTGGGVAESLLATNAAGPAIPDVAATATVPTLLPNRADAGTGIGWTSNDQLSFILNSVAIMEFNATLGFHSVNTGGPAFLNENAGATNPVLIPDQTDIDTGIGHGGADVLALVAGGTEALLMTEGIAGGGNIIYDFPVDVNEVANPGGGQGGLATGASYTEFVTVATAGDSMDLAPIVGSGRFQTVMNNQFTNAMDIFPDSGDEIIPNAANVAISLGPGETTSFISVSFTEHVQLKPVSGSLEAPNAAGPAILNIAATDTVPTIIPDRADPDSGLGSAAADSLSIIAGGLEMLRLVETVASATQQVRIALTIGGSAATPALAFGDGNTGFWENIDNVLNLGVAGSRVCVWTASQLAMDNAAGPAIRNVATTITVPSLAPSKADLDTGIGSDGSDSLDLISGGVNGMAFTELNSNVVQAPDAQVGLTAFATGGQGSATQVNASYAVFSTVATLADSGRLPPTFKVGSVITVKNDGAADMDMFPSSGDDLGAGTDTAVSIVAGTTAKFFATVADATWTQLAPVVAV